MNILAVVVGGALGALLRYAFASYWEHQTSYASLWATLAVNLMGCFCIGLMSGWAEIRGVPTHWRLFLVTGFLGALTTFSTYGLEIVLTTMAGRWSLAISYFILSNLLGLGLVFVGIRCSVFWLRP